MRSAFHEKYAIGERIGLPEAQALMKDAGELFMAWACEEVLGGAGIRAGRALSAVVDLICV